MMSWESAARTPRKYRADDDQTAERRSPDPSEPEAKMTKPEAAGPGRVKSVRSKSGGESVPPGRRRESRSRKAPAEEPSRSAVARAAPACESGGGLGGAASTPSVQRQKRDACLTVSATAGNAEPSAPADDSEPLGGTGSWVLPPSAGLLATASDEEDTDEDCLPSFFASPGSFEPKKDDLVWCKYQRYPYCPAVIKRVSKVKSRRRVTVLFFSLKMQSGTEKPTPIGVPVKHIKPFNCREKNGLIEEARKYCPKEMELFLELVTDYWSKIVSGSAMQKTFIEYCKSELSAPVWRGPSTSPPESIRDLPEPAPEMRAAKPPSLDGDEPPSPAGRHGPGSSETPGPSSAEKRLLPNRDETARRRANERLVCSIVRGRVAERRLRRVLRGAAPSPWLLEFRERRRLSERRVSLYLEDDGHVRSLVRHLGQVYERERELCAAERRAGFVEVDALCLSQFVVDVLLPEAVTCALMEMEAITWDEARRKFLSGPRCSRRELELFNIECMQRNDN